MKNKIHVKDQYCAGPLCDCKSPHTPAPWSVNGNRITAWDKELHVAAIPPESYSPWEANAAFIVRAVNAHEELIKAAKKVIFQQMKSTYLIPAIDELAGAVAKAEVI